MSRPFNVFALKKQENPRIGSFYWNSYLKSRWLSQLFHFQESFLCDEDFCGGPCAPKCLPPDGKECNGILVQLYDDPQVTGDILPFFQKKD